MSTVKVINIAEMSIRREEAMTAKNKACDELLDNIKARREQIESLIRSLRTLEPELVYRFYHQSFKVFWFTDALKLAKVLFSEIAPRGSSLNIWFTEILDYAIYAEFSDETSNKNWLSETRPILEALWHCKFFAEQMISSADSLEKAPVMLPYDWAAVLYLYDLR